MLTAAGATGTVAAMRKLVLSLPIAVVALGFLSSCTTTDVDAPFANGEEVAVDVCHVFHEALGTSHHQEDAVASRTP